MRRTQLDPHHTDVRQVTYVQQFYIQHSPYTYSVAWLPNVTNFVILLYYIILLYSLLILYFVFYLYFSLIAAYLAY